MIALVVAAVLSTSETLRTVEDFCGKIEIEIVRPLTEELLTKQTVDSGHQRIQLRIQDRYRLTYHRDRITAFADLRENIHMKLTRLDPAEMQQWSERPCPVDKDAALQIAQTLFHRLGFNDKSFDPPEIKRYRWVPSPANPGHVLWLPVFGIRWYQKGYPRDSAVPVHVHIDISGTTGKVVYYFDTTR